METELLAHAYTVACLAIAGSMCAATLTAETTKHHIGVNTHIHYYSFWDYHQQLVINLAQIILVKLATL